MKIDSSSISSSLPIGGSSPQVRTEKAQPAPSTSVSISDVSSKLQALEAEARQSAGFDAARVAAIKQAISEGKFQINPQMIAEKLLATARDLLQQQ